MRDCESANCEARGSACEWRGESVGRERSLKRFSGAQGEGGRGRAVDLPASLAWPGLAWQSGFQLRPVLTVDVEVDG